MDGSHESLPGHDDPSNNPSFDCVVGRHLFFDFLDEQGATVGGWCPWCGTGAYDADLVSMEGQPVGFTPTFVARIPDGFHRPAAGA
jgi:hypothetical protein